MPNSMIGTTTHAILATIDTVALLSPDAWAWSNGPSGNAATNEASECADPPYATHDWITEHAVMILPENEREWLMPHLAMYLLGTEAPDNWNCGHVNEVRTLP